MLLMVSVYRILIFEHYKSSSKYAHHPVLLTMSHYDMHLVTHLVGNPESRLNLGYKLQANVSFDETA